MKEYDAVFRNLKAARRDPTGSHKRYQEPAWLPFVGGVVMGLVFAVLLFLGV